MEALPTNLPEVLILEPRVFPDARGFFMESYSERVFDKLLGRPVRFVQDNHSLSRRGVLRGLHYQRPPNAQSKLVRVVSGRIFDVAVDVRRGSSTFGHWIGVNLSAENRRQLWVPAGFAHGFLVLSESADVLYKTDAYYAPESEASLRGDDPDVGIVWPPIATTVQLSDRDRAAPLLGTIEAFDTEGFVS